MTRPSNEELMVRYKGGDEEAKELLYFHNQRFVYSKAKKFLNTGIDINDLLSVGNVGFMKAIKSFDVDKNNQVLTYLARVIDNEILMFLRSNKKHVYKNISLDYIVASDGDGGELTLEDVLSDERIDLDENLLNEQANKSIKKFYHNLVPKHQAVFDRIILQNRGQKEVAKELGWSQSYVSRLVSKLLKKIRIITENEGLRDPENNVNKKSLPRKENIMNNRVNRSRFLYIINHYKGVKNSQISKFFECSEATVYNLINKIKENNLEYKGEPVVEDPTVAEEFDQFLAGTKGAYPVKISRVEDLPEEERAKYKPKEARKVDIPADETPDPVPMEVITPIEKIESKDQNIPELINLNYAGNSTYIKKIIKDYTDQVLSKLEEGKDINVKFILEIMEN